MKTPVMFLSLLLASAGFAAPAKKAATPPPAPTAPAKEAGLALKADPAASKVTFLAVGRPSMLKIHGTATAGPAGDLKVEGGQLQGAIEMDMDKLDTGIELRTTHMKDKYLQVKEHPKAKLSLTDAPVDADFAKTLSNSGEKPFKGKLMLHGKEQDVAGTYTARDGKVEAKFPLKLSDFAIDIPTYLGVTVADMVDVAVELPLKK